MPIVTGSHLDSVPDGGGYDGALGVASALAAVDELKARNFNPERSVGHRRLHRGRGRPVPGALPGEPPDDRGHRPRRRARALSDDDGVTLAAAMTAAGCDASLLGPARTCSHGLGAFVELHVEQGRALAPLGAAVGVAEGIWPHGRWRLDFAGRADHAGTARLADRNDPMLPYASTVLAARRRPPTHGALATFGKVIAEPGGANGVTRAVRAWLDARAPDEMHSEHTVTAVRSAAEIWPREHGVTLTVRQESYTPLVRFDEGLRDRIDGRARRGRDRPPRCCPPAPGTTPGCLAARIPTAMLFVRNPTGVSHSPAEHADPADCEAGVHALALVLEDLAGRP